MKHGFIKAAAGTPEITVADCEANRNAILKVIHKMEKEHAKIMVLSGTLYYRLHLSGSVFSSVSFWTVHGIL